MSAPANISDRLEYLRSQIRAESISMSELVELQGLAQHIAPGDVELLEWAGVPEHTAEGIVCEVILREVILRTLEGLANESTGAIEASPLLATDEIIRALELSDGGEDE